ncbi:MAG: hypothetical protein GIW95_02200 [Candidatus Eremiobacteraeota bacterium]|nr:hypothetical protein [Candidatus Eremiobacteraeota bacterium]
MKRIASVALLVALTTGPLGAEDLPVAGKAPVLRHLAFDFKSASTYSHEARGVKDLADAQGANTAHYDDRQEAIGTIVCDVVAVTADGGLVIDLREDGPQRKVASTRVGVQDRGQIVNLDPKQPLGEEIMVLLRFLGRNVIGAWERPAGETWEIENASGTYKARRPSTSPQCRRPTTSGWTSTKNL